MKHLNFVEPVPKTSEHLNLFGLGKDYDEHNEYEIRKKTEEARAKYPIDKRTDCTTIAVMIEQCQADLDRVMKIRAAGGSTKDRVIARDQIAFETRLSELKQWQSGQQCASKLEAAAQDQFYDTQYEQLQRVKTLSAGAGKTTTYLVFGMIGIFVLVAGVIIFKKLKKG